MASRTGAVAPSCIGRGSGPSLVVMSPSIAPAAASISGVTRAPISRSMLGRINDAVTRSPPS